MRSACARCRLPGHNRATCRTLEVATDAELSVLGRDPVVLAAEGLRPPGSRPTCGACGDVAHRGSCRRRKRKTGGP